MADPLSIAASIAGLIALAAQTSSLISSIASSNGLNKERTKELTQIGQEVSSFYVVLGELQGQLDNEQSSSQPVDALQSVLEGCMRTLKAVQEVLHQIHSKLNMGYLGRIKVHVSYSSKMKSITWYRELLDKYKATLSVALIVQKRNVLSPSTLRADLLSIQTPVDSVLQSGSQGGEDNTAMSSYINSVGRSFANSARNSVTLLPDANSSGAAAPAISNVTYNSFDEWLASFTPVIPPNESPAQRLEIIRHKREGLQEPSPAENHLRLRIEGLRKKDSPGLYTETLDFSIHAMTFELLELLFQKGYTNICGFRTLSGLRIPFGPITGPKAPYVVQITDGPSSYDIQSGYKINKDQRFIDFYNDYISLKETSTGFLEWLDNRTLASRKAIRALCDSCQNTAVSSHAANGGKEDKIKLWDGRSGDGWPETSISFERTLRVPETDTESVLPAQLGKFPLFSIETYKSSLPQEITRMGGLFIPIYQREALSVSFQGEGPEFLDRRKPEKEDYDYLENYAVKIYAGSVNVISGHPATERPPEVNEAQDFVVLPRQERLDGFCTSPGKVRQFVAMPPGKGYGVEEQVTGKGDIRGLQLEIFPRLRDTVKFARLKRHDVNLVPNETAFETPFDLFQTPARAGLKHGDYVFMMNTAREQQRPTDDLEYHSQNIPKNELFGAGPIDENRFNYSHYDKTTMFARPTFLRELAAWSLQRFESGAEIRLQTIGSLMVPVIDRRVVHAPIAQIQLSPFLDARYIPQNMLSDESEVQKLTHFPSPGYIVETSELFFPRSVSYTPLISIPRNELRIMLTEAFPGAAPPTRLNLAPGATLGQTIAPSKDKRMFAWNSGFMLNIHLLDAVSFVDVTKLIPPPCPISFEAYAKARLPFYKDGTPGVDISPGTLSTINSVGNLDSRKAIRWDVHVGSLESSELLGCTVCEVNLANTILKPCNHMFCSTCISQWMDKGTHVECLFCGSKVNEKCQFSALASPISTHSAILSSNQTITTPSESETLESISTWAMMRFGTSSLTRALEVAVEPKKHYASANETTYPFDFIIANLVRLPKETYTPIISGLLYSAAHVRSDNYFRTLLPLLTVQDVEEASPGAVTRILESCRYQSSDGNQHEQYFLPLLDWACAQGKTPDDWGIELNSTSSIDHVRQMLKLGADPNRANNDPRFGRGNMALHTANDYGLEAAEVLLAAGARIDVVNFDGETPVHVAAKEVKPKLLALLLKQPGAQQVLHLVDNEERTPLALVPVQHRWRSESDFEVVRQLLVEAEANLDSGLQDSRP